jgi:hypothetical protein
MSKYRREIICHNCNTKVVMKGESNSDECYKCGADKDGEHIEQKYVGGQLNQFLDWDRNIILK